MPLRRATHPAISAWNACLSSMNLRLNCRSYFCRSSCSWTFSTSCRWSLWAAAWRASCCLSSTSNWTRASSPWNHKTRQSDEIWVSLFNAAEDEHVTYKLIYQNKNGVVDISMRKNKILLWMSLIPCSKFHSLKYWYLPDSGFNSTENSSFVMNNHGFIKYIS